MGISKEQMQKNIERFEDLLKKTGREGVNKLIEYTRKSDFYEAPASTKFHLACEGGLLQHSLNAYDCLKAKAYNPVWAAALENTPAESMIITALLHDLCKTYFYKVSTRNVKNEQTGKWEKAPYYEIDDRMPIGHGEKSAFIIQKYMEITNEEFYAIRWHMGYTEPKEQWNTLSAAMEKYPLALALHEADLEASKLMEGLDGNKSFKPHNDPGAANSQQDSGNAPKESQQEAPDDKENSQTSDAKEEPAEPVFEEASELPE